MKKTLWLYISLLAVLFLGCKKDLQPYSDSNAGVAAQAKANFGENNSGHIKIAVLSDIHYMHPSLLLNDAANGTAFNNIFLSEPNKVLLEISPHIFNQVIAELTAERPDMVLVAGDMAKDGELVSHQAVASLLQNLVNKGIKVYVIPGNNDINSTKAAVYDGNSSYPATNVSPADFKSIYGNFGYNTDPTVISTDANSLSYVAEPFPGLRILALDPQRYNPPSRGATIKAGTMAWIKEQLADAREDNVRMFGLMHHNLIEHIEGQSGITPNTVVEDLSSSSSADNLDWQPKADSLISWGLEVMFCGHTHVTDINQRSFGGNQFYEIVTGSLVTPPSPYRMVVMKDNMLDISTIPVKRIEGLHNGQAFVDYSNEFLTKSFDAFFKMALGNPMGNYKLSPTVAEYAAPLGRNAWMAHINGDENISPLEQRKIDSLKLVIPYPATTIAALNAFWTDPGVKDKEWHIMLNR